MGDTQLLASIPLIQSVRESGDRGEPGVLSEDSEVSEPFKQLAKRVVLSVSERNARLSPTKVVHME
jgi:ATP-binding protein involved in chromosome partitioning